MSDCDGEASSLLEQRRNRGFLYFVHHVFVVEMRRLPALTKTGKEKLSSVDVVEKLDSLAVTLVVLKEVIVRSGRQQHSTFASSGPKALKQLCTFSVVIDPADPY